MKNIKKMIYIGLVSICMITMFGGCKSDHSDSKEVVIYTSVDQVYSEPILKEFENKTGIKVVVKYDVEAAKTTGLVNKLIAEKDNPQADVFWNGEFAQTILLKEKELLMSYESDNMQGIPAQYRDAEGYWYGFGGRARVIIINTNLLSEDEYPTSIYDFLDSSYDAEKIAIAYPLFGTTATHASALYGVLGSEKGKEFFEKIKARDIRIVDGNSVVRDLVASGDAMFGLTDTDDAAGAIAKGAPVTVVFPDQNEEGLGTLIVPNTVAIVKDGPNTEEGKLLLEYLLSTEVEEKLMASGWFQISFRGVQSENNCFETDHIKGMEASLTAIYKNIESVKKELGEIFIR